MRKEKIEKEKKKKTNQNYEELQKPNTEAEVYYNNKRWNWEKKKKAQKLNWIS